MLLTRNGVPNMFSILIADDHPVVRRGLRTLLQTKPDWAVVAEAANGSEAVAQAKKLRPHVAILDISMPQINGLDACAMITKDLPETRVLIVTMHPAQDMIAKTVKAGAHGYVLKSDPEPDLIKAVEALVHHRTFFTPTASEIILRAACGNAPDEDASPLSARETEMVQLLAEGRSNKEAAFILGISTRTAENHRARVMHKLGLTSLSELVRYAIRNRMIEA